MVSSKLFLLLDGTSRPFSFKEIIYRNGTDNSRLIVASMSFGVANIEVIAEFINGDFLRHHPPIHSPPQPPPQQQQQQRARSHLFLTCDAHGERNLSNYS